ncbi:MAG: C-terminal target protein [Bacteroidetes bacterium]|nr:C-terminal target protein [Bacteroidota bacterium]
MRSKPLHILLTLLLLNQMFSFGQSNPAPQNLTYSENFSGLAWAATAYPTGLQGWQLAATGITGAFRTTAPTGDLALVASGDASAVAGGFYNYNGKIGFLSSGSVDPALCFSINTTGLNGVTVSFDAMTIRNPHDGGANTRINEMGLQYRLGTAGAFTNVTGFTYQNNTTTQTGAVTTPQNLQSFSVLLPTACDNQAVVQVRWVSRQVSGGGSRPSFALDNIFVSSCTTNTSTYYYRSRQTGSWNTYSTWEASLNGITGWSMACSAPTSAAAAITILSSHTVTINTNATAPNLTVDGILIFDNTARTVAVTDYVTVSSSGIFVTQAAGTATHSMSIGGDLTNNGTFDMSRGGLTLVCNVTFNRNGNQSIMGTGATTRFNFISLNMGTSSSNVLDVSPSFFAAATSFLHPSAAASPNGLLNGTLKLSGTFSFTGTFFKSGVNYNIVSTAGIWINNPNVTINGTNDSYDVSGKLKISAGTFNAGTAVGNAIRLLDGSSMTVTGGAVNVSGRIQAYESTGATAQITTYNQSGGVVTVSKAGVNATSMPEFTLDLPSDSLIMSGGTIIFHSQASVADDLLNRATSVITGGLIQFGEASTTTATAAGFYVESYSALPSLSIYPCNSVTRLVLATNLTVKGSITIGNLTTLNNRWGTLAQTYNITLSGDWINNGTFINNGVRTVTFNGSSAQNITGTSSTTFNSLTINNSSGGVTLQMPATVNANLSLSNGYLYTSATNLLSMSAGSAVTAVNNNSFVYGPMSKTGTTNFTFPVGKDLEYRPIGISSLTGSETFTAEYFHADPSILYPIALMDPTITHIDGCEYWTLERAGSADAFVTLSWDTYSCGVTSLPDLSVARFDAGLTMWKDEGNGGTTGTTSTGTISTAALVSTFGPFTLASTIGGGVNPLPVELLDFSAAYNGSDVDLQWSTASELNNDHFTVERSANGSTFYELNEIPGAGNSTQTLSYATVDKEPLSGTSYYRLKQVDFNGNSTYSSITAIDIEMSSFGILFTTEINDALSITFNCTGDNCLVSVDLFELSGKKVFSARKNLSEEHEIIFPAGLLAKGIYLLNVSNGEERISRKINLK